MEKYKTSEDVTSNVQVNVDVTKIVKYTCITSVVIVITVFAAKVVRDLFGKNYN